MEQHIKTSPRHPPRMSSCSSLIGLYKHVIYNGSFYGQQASKQLSKPLTRLYLTGQGWSWLLLVQTVGPPKGLERDGEVRDIPYSEKSYVWRSHLSSSFRESSPHYHLRLRTRAICWDSQVEHERIYCFRHL